MKKIPGEEEDNSMYDKRKAILAEKSHRVYEQILCLVFSNKYNISNSDKVLLYCLLHKAISIRQVCMLYEDIYNNGNGITMILHRLSQKKYIKKVPINSLKAYSITLIGLNKCKRLIQNLFPDPLDKIRLAHEYYSYTFDEAIEELMSQCQNTQPAYWQHYLAERDIFIYLLRNVNQVNKFEYETEVAISHGGVIESIFSKKYQGVNLKYAIRSDGLLKCFTKREYFYLKFLVELDTGTQKSSQLLDKVQKYITYYVDSRSYTPDTSLIFSINTDLTNDTKIRVKNKKISIADCFYANTLNCITEIAEVLGSNINRYLTVGEFVSRVEMFLEECQGNQNMEGLKQLVKYIKSKPYFFNNASCINSLMDRYKEACEEDSKQKKLNEAELHLHRYMKRRALLHQSIINVPMVKAVLMQGFSIYTVENFDLKRTLGYIHPELMDVYHRIGSMLARVNFVNIGEEPEYELYKQISNEILYRNAYYFIESRVSIIVENISDDIGGYYRIFNLLEENSIPSALISTKVICLCDDYSIEEIKTKYLMTKQGKELAAYCSESISDGFDVLFATYSDISNTDYFFSFSSDGKIVKKTMREMPVRFFRREADDKNE